MVYGRAIQTILAYDKFITGASAEVNKNRNGNLVLIHGSSQFLSKSILNIEPKVGDFYFFPHYLMHAVYPFSKSEDERRSVSFNAKVDQSLFNE